MPTGYTAAVADGTVTDLRAFALLCARGMGACIMMRDEPWDAPIPLRFEPRTTYHDERLAEARKEADRLNALTPDQRVAEAGADFAERHASWAESRDKRTATYNRYNAMLAQVVHWLGAPEGLKEFMLEQLRTGRDFDAIPDLDKYSPEPQPQDPITWFREAMARAQNDIAYHSKEIAAEIERTENRNVWLKQLHEALPGAA